MPDDNSKINAVIVEEEEKQTAPVAAEVAPGRKHIAQGPNDKCVEPIRDSFLCIGPDPETDD